MDVGAFMGLWLDASCRAPGLCSCQPLLRPCGGQAIAHVRPTLLTKHPSHVAPQVRVVWYIFLMPLAVLVQCTYVPGTVALLMQYAEAPDWLPQMGVEAGYAVTMVTVWVMPLLITRINEQNLRRRFMDALRRELQAARAAS